MVKTYLEFRNSIVGLYFMVESDIK